MQLAHRFAITFLAGMLLWAATAHGQDSPTTQDLILEGMRTGGPPGCFTIVDQKVFVLNVTPSGVHIEKPIELATRSTWGPASCHSGLRFGTTQEQGEFFRYIGQLSPHSSPVLIESSEGRDIAVIGDFHGAPAMFGQGRLASPKLGKQASPVLVEKDVVARMTVSAALFERLKSQRYLAHAIGPLGIILQNRSDSALYEVHYADGRPPQRGTIAKAGPIPDALTRAPSPACEPFDRAALVVASPSFVEGCGLAQRPRIQPSSSTAP